MGYWQLDEDFVQIENNQPFKFKDQKHYELLGDK